MDMVKFGKEMLERQYDTYIDLIKSTDDIGSFAYLRGACDGVLMAMHYLGFIERDEYTEKRTHVWQLIGEMAQK